MSATTLSPIESLNELTPELTLPGVINTAGGGALTTVLEGMRDRLQQFAQSADAFDRLNAIFADADTAVVQARLADWAAGMVPDLPTLRVIEDGFLPNASGAYAAANNTIYLAASLLQGDDLTGLTAAVLEEYGHALDQQFNPSGDTLGDEGEHFRRSLLGETLDAEDLANLQTDDDWGMVTLGDSDLFVEFNDSIGTASNLGTLRGDRSIQGFIGNGDNNDYFRFSVDRTSQFRLSLTGLSADADVQLLSSTGRVLTSSLLSGVSSESITRQLSAGTYYARVFPFRSASTNYTLNLSTDGVGNTPSTALNLGALTGDRTFQEFVGGSDTNDYYRFTVGQNNTPVSLNLTGLSADADMQLLNGAGQVIQSSRRSGTLSESMTALLNTGTYYARVYPFRNANTSYTLNLSTDPGETRSTAFNLGSLGSATRAVSNFVGIGDSDDYYQFSVSQGSNFSLSLTGLTADADVQLLNSSGRIIASSILGGSASERINQQLATGTYYVRVYPYSGNTNYTLNLAAPPVPTIPDGAGNTLARARNLGTLSGNRTFQDFVGSSDTNDYYRFTLANSSNFTLALTGLGADADVQLLNRQGQVIQSSLSSGTASERITRQLAAGDYFVRVYPYSGNTNYNLALSATAIAPPDGAGNSLAAARNIGTLSRQQIFRDFVGAVDTNDYYRFDLNQASNFSLALTGLRSDADVQLLNAQGQLIEGSYGAFDTAESIVRPLASGTYYVRVYPYSGDTNYSLALSAAAIQPVDNAGNTFQTARNVGVLSGNQSFVDYVGAGDTNDYYRFELAQNSNFSLTLTGLTADADVSVFNSFGQLLGTSDASGTSDESLNGQLSAGTYYVQVYPYSGNTNYNLTLSANTNTSSYSALYGYGLVDAAAAVALALGQTTPFADVPNLGGNNWGNDMVNAPEVWAQGYTGQGVVVAVIDSGVDINHQDLRNNIWRNTDEIAGNGIDDDRNGYVDDVFGWNFGRNQNNNNVLPGTSDPGQGHGTHVAGTIAAANNNLGVTGVAHGAQIMAIRMGDVQGNAFPNAGSLAQAIRYAVDNGADVINMSLGWSDSPELRDALAYAASRNVITVSAAGNSSLAAPGVPARYATQYGVSVGAVDNRQVLASFSNRAGTNSAMQHVVAPGVNVYSTTPNNTYGFKDGTSMASPHVAGVIALMLDANPNLTHAQVRDILTRSAVQLS